MATLKSESSLLIESLIHFRIHSDLFLLFSILTGNNPLKARAQVRAVEINSLLRNTETQ